MTSKINLKMQVSEDLEIIDKCYQEEINHGNCYNRFITVNDEGSINQTLCEVLHNICIRSTSWSKQKLAEHCNNVLLSHSAFILKAQKNNTNLYYPHLRIIVGVEE